MANILPPYIDRNCKSSAEKKIFNIFKNNSFSEDWIILHSLNISQHTVRLFGEIDFLILIPGAGIFVLEVKGGDVKCINGSWEFTDRFGTPHKGRNPFNQARDAMFSLRTSIDNEFKSKYKNILYGFFCAFPDISFNKQSIEYDPWQIVDRDTIQVGLDKYFNLLVNNFIKKYSTQSWFSKNNSLPNKEALFDICQFLRGDFERLQTVEDRLTEFNASVKKYTEEQYRILDSVQLNNRSIIQGSAGTGKTMLAIESAIRTASQGRSVFLTCYNKLISEWMQKQLEDWKDLITVNNLHSFLYKISKGFSYDSTIVNKQEFYTNYLPLLVKTIYDKEIASKFDKIILDEGQDLIREEYLSLFDSMLNEGMSNGNWEIYGDFEKQAIYSQLQKNKMFDLLDFYGNYSNFLLQINCRNTKQIGEETSLLSGFEKPPFLLEHLEGIPVDYRFYNNMEVQTSTLNECLKKLLNEQVPYDELVILSTKKYNNSCVKFIEEYPIKEIKDNENNSSKNNYFRFSTIQSFKGMESNYVIMVDIDDLTSEVAKSLLYIGMSRAKYGLIILLSDSTKEIYNDILRSKFK